MKKIAIILLAIALASPVFAQGRFGKDSAECVKYLSYYSELLKQNNLDEAAPFWHQAFSLCPPTANQTMLINGQKILRYEIKKNAKDAKRRAELIDTLLLTHEIRAQYYPKYFNKSYDNKAIDVITYFSNDNAKMYEVLSEVVDKIGSEASPVVFVKYMQAAAAMYKDGKIDADKVMAVYTRNGELMDVKIAAGDGAMAGAKQDVETILADSGVASCDNLIALYTPRYQADPENQALLSTIVKLLAKSDCVNTDLFLNSVESLNKIDPSASSAYYLYKLYSSRDDNTKAASALENAISLLAADDTKTKGEYCFELATFLFKKCGKSAAAVEKAKEAVNLNQAFAGKAYLLIGTIWGSQKCSGNEVDVRSPYWVAVDYMQKAKNADPSLEEEANNLAAQYRRYFPQQADAFMYDIIDGQSYTVSCGGMRESTTVRTVK